MGRAPSSPSGGAGPRPASPGAGPRGGPSPPPPRECPLARVPVYSRPRGAREPAPGGRTLPPPLVPHATRLEPRARGGQRVLGPEDDGVEGAPDGADGELRRVALALGLGGDAPGTGGGGLPGPAGEGEAPAGGGGAGGGRWARDRGGIRPLRAVRPVFRETSRALGPPRARRPAGAAAHASVPLDRRPLARVETARRARDAPPALAAALPTLSRGTRCRGRAAGREPVRERRSVGVGPGGRAPHRGCAREETACMVPRVRSRSARAGGGAGPDGEGGGGRGPPDGPRRGPRRARHARRARGRAPPRGGSPAPLARPVRPRGRQTRREAPVRRATRRSASSAEIPPRRHRGDPPGFRPTTPSSARQPPGRRFL